ncbi:RING-H2 finger protein ATL22-like [Rhodamnia argentea]|uniref:RING-type E3 ubiquitin transferase n=1 Tax=Rhodamnia argentea TaxID=178133 RepID=A0A8B8Q1B8_9MYRT|nr:RING-H2 finger protein ATL22-like [Rhodamnia argentea]
MASSPIFSSMSLFSLLVLQVMTSQTTSTNVCPIGRCSLSGPDIRFPFRIREVQGECCGYEGFEVSCDDRNRTILRLSKAGDFVVDNIDYAGQYILLKDPNDCLPKRLLKDQFKISSSPFVALDYKYFVLTNCSSENSSVIGLESSIMRLDCLSLAYNVTVVVLSDYFFTRPWMLQQQCHMWNISSPWRGQHPTNINESIWLRWLQPDCRSCEAAKGRCRLKDSTSGSELTCIRKPGLWMVARYAMASLFLLPWFMCVFGFIWFLKVRVFVRRGLDQISFAPPNDVNEEAAEVARRNAIGVMGIDSATIKSYPKAQIDDLGQLPRPSDDICTICLSKYEQNETIRTIPDCEHYFHAYCIDRWLRKNASCPLCRNYKV